MKNTTWLLGLLIGTQAFASHDLIGLDGLSKPQIVQIENALNQLPSKLTSSLPSKIKIKVKSIFNLNDQVKRVGQYNDITKTLTLNPDVFKDELILKKTLNHELAHVYEYNVEKLFLIPEYQMTAGLHKRGLFPKKLKQRNYLQSASVDSYEFKNVRESFPVNFEAFTTDPEFQCRKPLLNKFLTTYFEHTPFPGQECQMVQKIPVTINNQLVYQDMDFSQLYQIHYLFAAKGEAAMSRWGHSMIRLVFCAPGKTVKDESCVKDVAHHWVISFRANVQDIQINNIKGIMGKYPSEIFIFPMLEIIKEYTKIELRDLVSLPLALTAEQLSRMKDHVLETSYAYRGKYRFFTVNCATETLNFLQIVMNDQKFYGMQTLTPLQLFRKLKKMDFSVVNKVANQEEAIKTGHHFNGQTDILAKSFDKISPYIRASSLKDYAKETDANERKAFFEGRALSTNEWASIILIEKNILEKFQKDFMEDVAKKVVDLLDKDKAPQAVKYLEGLRFNIIENNAIKYDWKGYGIPFEREFIEPELKQSDLPENAGEEARKWILENFPRQQEELDFITNNINFFTTKMKETIRGTK